MNRISRSAALEWFLTLSAAAGAYLNAYGFKESFYIWICTNLGFLAANVRRRLWAQAALFVALLVSSIIGAIR